MARPGLTRDAIAGHNERVKLMATSLNAVGIGLIGFAVLRPLTDNPAGLTLSALWWIVAGLAFHALAHYVLGRLVKKADPHDAL
ncbi:MAG: hypothetical protein NXH97_05650 [Rhodobacteraceae bacterium]|nr:hypothetical protein [Paracoccaceae bacterium]